MRRGLERRRPAHLVVGDENDQFKGKPTQSADEKLEEKEANDELTKRRKAWADALQRYRGSRASDRETPEQMGKGGAKERIENLS